MSKPVTIPNAFAAQVGPIPLSQLDANFTAVAAAINDTASYTNYFVDSSGAPNTITVTVSAPLTFAYVAGIGLQVKLANTNTSTTVNINVNALGNKVVLMNDGTAPPVGSLTANSIYDVVYDGVNFRVLNQRASLGTGLFADGTAGAPSISFASDPTKGMYSFGANAIAIATAGTARIQINNSALLLGTSTQLQNGDGSAGAPAMSFSNETTLGWYRRAAGNLTGGVGGVRVVEVNAGGFDLVPTTAVLTVPDGSVTNPSMAFRQQVATGFYRQGSAVIGVALNGSNAGTFDQGTFTGTLTGMTGSVTGTFNYMRITNLAVVWTTANISGTSNSPLMTLTGLPSPVQPGGTRSITACEGGNDGGTSVLTSGTITSGTMTINRVQSSPAIGGGWAGAGTKGLFAGWATSYPL